MRKKLMGIATIVFAFVPLMVLEGQGLPKQPSREQQANELLKDIRRDGGLLKSSKEVTDSLAAMRELSEGLRSFGLQQQLVSLIRFHGDPAVKREAARTLAEVSRLSDNAAAVVEQLTKLLEEPDAELRASALLAISRMVPNANAAMPKVLKAMKDDDPRVRRAAYGVIARAVVFDKAMIPQVVAAIDDPDVGPDPKQPGVGSVSWWAFYELSMVCKTGAKGGARKLIKIINSWNKEDAYHFRALLALAAIAPEERAPIDIARRWLKQTDNEEVLRKATGVLATLGPHAKDAVPDLIAVANLKPFADPLIEQRVKMAVVGTFGNIGSAAREALPILEKLANSDDLTLRQHVLETIKKVRAEK